MLRKVSILLTLGLFGVLRTEAQDQLKLGGIEYVSYPSVALKDDASGFETDYQEFAAFVAVPKMLKNKKTILINGLNYGFVQSTLTNDSLGYESSQVYYRIGYTINVIQRMKNDWIFSGRLAPTLASDFDRSLNKQDFILLGSLIMTKKLNERAKLGGGLVHTMRLGTPLLIPVIQYSYKLDKHAFNVFLPAILSYNYTVDKQERLKVGVKVAANGANFNASKDKFSNIEVDRLNYVRINLGPDLSYRLTDILMINAAGGISAKRMYKFKDVHGDTYDYNSKSGAFFNIGIALVPPPKKKKQ